MKVGDRMTRDVKIANPEQSLRDVAQMIGSLDAGVMPVGDNDRLIGMITDRDIVVRGVALGNGPDAKVRDIMSVGEIKYCIDDEDVEHVLANMGDLQVRRLPVLNRDKRLVGIICLATSRRMEKRRRPGRLWVAYRCQAENIHKPRINARGASAGAAAIQSRRLRPDALGPQRFDILGQAIAHFRRLA